MSKGKRSRAPGTNMPEVPPGAIKAVPRRGETPAEAVARVQANHPGKLVVDPPARGGFNASNRSATGNAYARVMNAPIFPIGNGQPMSAVSKKQIRLPSSGLEFSTYYARDPFRVTKPEVVVLPYQKQNWGVLQPTGVTTPDTTAQGIGTRITNGFQQIVDVININGRFTPNQTLSANADWTAYLNNYTEAFSILWAFFSAVEALDMNQSTRAIGAGLAGSGNLDLAAILWRRLQLVVIPPEIPKLISKLTGFIRTDEQDWGFLTYSDHTSSDTTVTDWTVSSQVATLLGVAQTAIANLEGGTEANIVQEVLAQVYGSPEPLPTPCVQTSPILFDLHYTRCSVFKVTTFFAEPVVTSASPGGTVPVLIRRGYETDPDVELAFSFFRPQMYDASGTTGSLGANNNVVGLLTTGSTEFGYSRFYGAGANNNTILTDGTFTALNYGNSTFEEIEYWASFVQSSSGTASWLNDSRAWDRWYSFYPNVAALGDQSMVLADKFLFTGMKIRDLK